MANIFIDASGLPGLYKEETRSPFFVVAAVFFPSDSDVSIVNAIQAELLPRLPHDEGEFKSSKPCSVNIEFIEQIIEQTDWCFCTALGNRIEFEGSGFEYPKSCQKWFTHKALSMIPTALRDGYVKIDEGGALSEAEVLKHLKPRLANPKWRAVQSVNCVSSIDCPGVQVADLLAGIIHKYVRREELNKRSKRRAEERFEQVAFRETNQWYMKPSTVRSD